MSHQLYFYMVPSDIKALESQLRAIGPLSILTERANSSRPRLADSLDFCEQGERVTRFYLSRPKDLDRILMVEVPAQGYWCIEGPDSYAIQFNAGFFDGKHLREGRLYWTDHFYTPDGDRVSKSAEFRAWAAKVRATAKKFLKRYNSKLIGPDTELWLARAGGRLAEVFEIL